MRIKILQIGRGFNKGGLYDICPSLTAHSFHENNFPVFYSGKRINLRKFTPDECFRLMGFHKHESEKASSLGVSDASLYKQAGNGIIADCIGEISQVLYDAYFKNEDKVEI